MPAKPLTPKGERTARRVLDAALRCVGQDGLASLSLQRVADEAGVGKRAVIYYFETREGLLDAVVRTVGDRMLDQLEHAVRDVDDPAAIVERGFEIVWTAVTTDRVLLAAWFGLHAESVTNAEFSSAGRYIGDRLEHIARELIEKQIDLGRRVRIDPVALRVLIVASIQGLAAYYLQHGETEPLRAAIGEFRGFLSSVVTH